MLPSTFHNSNITYCGSNLAVLDANFKHLLEARFKHILEARFKPQYIVFSYFYSTIDYTTDQLKTTLRTDRRSSKELDISGSKAE